LAAEVIELPVSDDWRMISLLINFEHSVESQAVIVIELMERAISEATTRATGRPLFRSRLDQIIDMKHALVKPARTIDWGFLEQRLGRRTLTNPGQPPLPARLMAGLALKYAH
jgi:hypothetical protein